MAWPKAAYIHGSNRRFLEKKGMYPARLNHLTTRSAMKT